MSGQGNGTPTGDSTPDLEFLREHDDGSRTRWPTDPEHDSATDMLPPEDEGLETLAESDEAELGAGENGSSIHGTVPEPSADTEPEQTHETDPVDSMPSGETGGPPVGDPEIEDVVDTVAQVAGALEGLPSDSAGLAETAAPTEKEPARKNNLFLVALASYASAVTIALLYLLFQRATAEPSQLESLPDVAPLREDEVLFVPVDAEMPPGHTLALGQSQRFGNIVVTPLRVVRERLSFVHFSRRDDVSRPDSEPVLKLWVRFANVSDEQSIAPLDGELLFTRKFRQEIGETWANQFVCSLDAKRAGEEPVFVYDHSPSAEFDLVDQELGRVLQPGETFETYIPTTEESLDSLTGELVWRVHFRKGYSPKGYGVTTVVEVRFDESDIRSRSSAA